MILDYRPEEYTGSASTKELGQELARLQRRVLASEEKINYIIMLEGWESSGRGKVMRDIMRELDHRYIRACSLPRPRPSMPYNDDLWQGLPAYGHGTIYSHSSYEKLLDNLGLEEDLLDAEIRNIRHEAQTLYDDNTILIKIFIDVDKALQRERIEKASQDPYRNLYVSQRDMNQNLRYDAMRSHFNRVLTKSNFSFSPWHIISGTDLKQAGKQALQIVIDELSKGLERIEGPGLTSAPQSRNYVEKEQLLDQVDPNVKVSKQEYQEQLEALQARAAELQLALKARDIPCLIVFEGSDAAGKGGSIKRLIRLMDPRFCFVSTTAAPSEYENSHHYLWRFYTNFPDYGNITIFDRSWYGRVLVERVEGFAKADEWERAYDEINKMEESFVQRHGLVLKYYLHIDKEEQGARFQDRMDDEDKLYKITDEDWRNRDKWDLYWKAANEMLVRTSTAWAPWKIVPGNNKRAARLAILRDFISRAETALQETDYWNSYHPF